jgi:hypothetical protein
MLGITMNLDESIDSNRVFFLHTLFNDKHMRHTETSLQKRASLAPGRDVTFYSPVSQNGSILELCIAQAWNALGNSTLKVSLEFIAISAQQTSLNLNPSSSIARLDLRSLSDFQKLNISGSLSNLEEILTPVESETTIGKCFDPRDVLPNGSSVFQLELSYNFELSEKNFYHFQSSFTV